MKSINPATNQLIKEYNEYTLSEINKNYNLSHICLTVLCQNDPSSFN